jgi:hypothetical protein
MIGVHTLYSGPVTDVKSSLKDWVQNDHKIMVVRRGLAEAQHCTAQVQRNPARTWRWSEEYRESVCSKVSFGCRTQTLEQLY